MSKFHIPGKVVYVCTGSKCGKRGGKDLYKSLRSYVKYIPGDDIEVVRTDCTDRCKFAPVVVFQPGNTWIKECTEKQAIKQLERLTETIG